MKDALSNIIHSSNLKTLSLNGITEMPITIFLHNVHLTTLELDWVEFRYEYYKDLQLADSRSFEGSGSNGFSLSDRPVFVAFEELFFICVPYEMIPYLLISH